MALNCSIQIIFAVSSIETAFVPGLHRYDDGKNGEWTMVEDFKTVIFVLTIGLVIQLIEYKWYSHVTDLAKENALAHYAELMDTDVDAIMLYTPFWGTFWFYCELFMASIHALPNFITRMHVEVNLLVFLRFYFLFHCAYLFSHMYRRRHAVRRLVSKTSKFKEMSALGLTHIQGAYSSHTIVRALFKERPWHCLIFMTFVSYTVSAYCVYVRERSTQWEDFGTFTDALWFTAVTMTTVGYGGQEPHDDIGRVIAMLACTTGIVLVSLSVVVMVNDLQFTELEQSSIRVINRLKAAKKLKNFYEERERYGANNDVDDRTPLLSDVKRAGSRAAGADRSGSIMDDD